MAGYIKLHRKMTEWEWYDDINTKVLFLHILLKANYKDKKWRGIDIKRGQFLTSLETLVRETSLTTQQVRTSLDKLKSTGEITSQITNRNRLLTIVNYTQYQATGDDTTEQVTSKRTGKQQAGNKLVTTTKEGKEVKEGKEDNIKVVLPDYIDAECFNNFIEMRKAIKSPVTEKANTLLLNKLDKFYNAGYNVNEILDNSTMNNWKGVFEPKQSFAKQNELSTTDKIKNLIGNIDNGPFRENEEVTTYNGNAGILLYEPEIYQKT